jgi:hypothetical protein
MPTPNWLRSYWDERLAPALQAWEQKPGEPEQLKGLFEQMLSDWPQIRGKSLSDNTVASYLTQTREWLSKLPLTEANSTTSATGERQHLALVYFNFPAEHWAELTMRSQAKMEQRTQSLLSLPDPGGIIARGRELLVYSDWEALSAGILSMVGRRVGEVLLAGNITPKSDYTVMFTGQLKVRGKPDYIFEIPTLCEADRVLAAWERLRTHPDLLAMNLPMGEATRANLDKINGLLYPRVRKAVTHFFAELVPGVGEEEDEEKLYSHLLRSLYATLAVWKYCPERVEPDTFRAEILGHRSYFQMTNEQRLNFVSGHYYHRFIILLPSGSLDGRRGIALSEPGVKVLDAFPQKEVEQTVPLSGKKKSTKRKKKARNSKTGYSLIKPRNESAREFDQIAEENGIEWKREDDTLRLLLNTYRAHQQCQPGQSSTLVPGQLQPSQLALPEPLVADILAAMQQSGQDSFYEFLRQALERASKARLNMGRFKKERETKPPDFSTVPTSKLLATRRLPETYERIRRAIATIIEHNRRCSENNERWYITQTLLRQFTGAHPRYIQPVLEANAELIKRHHEHFGIVSAHNRTPAPKPVPIEKSLTIAETVAEIPALSEIVLPSLEESVEADTATV